MARQVVAPAPLGRHISAGRGVTERELRAGSQRPTIVCARRLVCRVAVQGRRYSGAGVAPYFGVTTSAVNRLAASAELPEVRRYFKAL